MANEQVLAVLKRGMSTEVWGLRFYEQAIARTQAKDGKKVFEGLVVEEEKHLDILRNQYVKLGGQVSLSTAQARAMADEVKPTDIFPEAASAGQLIPADAPDTKALEIAMDFERRGFVFYQQEAGKVVQGEIKAMWASLAKAEDSHFAYLQKTHEYLTTNGVWYFDELERPFFEG